MTRYQNILQSISEIRKHLNLIEEGLEEVQAHAEKLDNEVEMEFIEKPIPSIILPLTNGADEVVGGTETEQFPDCCAVACIDEYCCSGTLIAPNVVVTAKHCLNITHVFLKGNSIFQPEKGEVIRISHQFSHPEEDIKALILERMSSCTPRHVAQGNELYHAKTATIAGFGRIDSTGAIGYGVKRKAEVPILSLNCSHPSDSIKYGCRSKMEMVAGHLGLMRDTCRGDSGGPLYIKSKRGDYHLLGATSRGTREAGHVCGDGGIYVRVDLCLDWIRQITGVEIDGPLIE